MQLDQCSLIHNRMTLMSRFFLVNQNILQKQCELVNEQTTLKSMLFELIDQ